MLRSTSCIILFHLLFSVQQTVAQNSSDSVFYRQLLDSTLSIYKNSLRENIHLYNGSEYIGSYPGTVGHAYFESGSLQNGDIFYDGTFYQDVPMLYDLVTGDVVIPNYSKSYMIRLVNEKISYFSVMNHTFIRITENSSTGTNTRFYDVLYTGEISVLARRWKQILFSLKPEEPSKFIQYNRYFIKKGDSYHEVDSRASLVALFGDQKDEIKKYLRKNKINFKRNMEDAIIKSVEYYAQLKK